MTTDIVPSQWFTLSPVGVQVHADVPEAVWASTLESLLRFRDALPWIIGDLILYGESRYGETYAQAIQVTGRAYDTLAGYVRVCRAIPLEQRNPDVPFSYHKAVALKALSGGQRADLLGQAADGKLANSTELAEAVRDVLGVEAQEVIDAIPCPICGENGWDARTLDRAECPHCHAHGSELAELAARYEALRVAFDELAEEYRLLSTWKQLEDQ